MNDLETTELLLRLGSAVFFGALIGIERERRAWSAGLRTHAIVCLGAALAMVVSAHGFSDLVGVEGVDLDPSRVAAQVVSGVGFLGAGTIIFFRQQVIKGLTTAAGLWSVACLGLACGAGMFLAAALATALMLFILFGLSFIGKSIAPKAAPAIRTIHATLRSGIAVKQGLDEILRETEQALASYTLDVEGDLLKLTITIKPSADVSALNLLQSRILLLEDVTHLETRP